MLNRVNQVKRNQYLSVGLIFLLLLAATPVAAQSVEVGDSSFSGDDAYDPAAGGLPAISLNAAPERSIRSSATTLSGDDAYDPAAGGLPATLADAAAGRSIRSSATSLSGDDPYDPAATGTLDLSEVGFVLGSGSELACAPTASELEARRTRSMKGGFSGDDAYDPAAGGTPELSLLAPGLDPVACAPAAGGN
jgi:hypothetical protein